MDGNINNDDINNFETNINNSQDLFRIFMRRFTRQLNTQNLNPQYIDNVLQRSFEEDKVKVQNIEILIDTVEGAWVLGIPDQTNIIIGGQGFVKEGDEVISKFK